eukprot:2254503-Rhodomonas_salina.3
MLLPASLPPPTDSRTSLLPPPFHSLSSDSSQYNHRREACDSGRLGADEPEGVGSEMQVAAPAPCCTMPGTDTAHDSHFMPAEPEDEDILWEVAIVLLSLSLCDARIDFSVQGSDGIPKLRPRKEPFPCVVSSLRTPYATIGTDTVPYAMPSTDSVCPYALPTRCPVLTSATLRPGVLPWQRRVTCRRCLATASTTTR